MALGGILKTILMGGSPIGGLIGAIGGGILRGVGRRVEDRIVGRHADQFGIAAPGAASQVYQSGQTAFATAADNSSRGFEQQRDKERNDAIARENQLERESRERLTLAGMAHQEEIIGKQFANEVALRLLSDDLMTKAWQREYEATKGRLQGTPAEFFGPAGNEIGGTSGPARAAAKLNRFTWGDTFGDNPFEKGLSSWFSNWMSQGIPFTDEARAFKEMSREYGGW